MGDFDVTFTVYGEPASKANSRKMVLIKGRPALIKSQKARDYVKTFEQQCPVLEVPTTEDVVVEMMIYYASRRPDLDESLILDCMQCRIYKNDRQVKQKFIYWGLDRENPRTIIRVRSCDVKDIPKFVELLENDNRIIRYWGASGLLSLGEKAAPAIEDLKVAVNDSSGTVATLACELLSILGEKEMARKTEW